MTWTLLSERTYASIVDGDVVLVELAMPIEELLRNNPESLNAIEDGVRSLQREVGGHCVKQISVGAPGFGTDHLASASDVPILIAGERV